MTRARWFLWAALAAILVVGCKQDLKSCPDCPITTIAIFDPAAGIIPLPNDIAKAETGKLPTTAEVTLPDGTTKTLATFPPPMKEFVENYLNQAPGFPVEQPLSVKFSSADVDPATLTAETILLFDVTEVRAAFGIADKTQRDAALAAATVTRVEGLVISPPVETNTYTEDATLMPSAKYWEVSIAPSMPLDPGRYYFAVVTTGVKDTKGAPVAAAQVFAYLKSKTPLATCQRDDQGEILKDAQGRHLCTADVFVSDNQTESIELAVQLEAVRQSLAPFLDYLEALPTSPVKRSEVAVAWGFTTWPVQAVLDPTNGVIPLPNNLVRAPNGPVAIPVSDAMSPTFKAFVQNYLNTLDGFPQLQPLSLPLNAKTVDMTSLAGAGVRVFDITALLAELAKATPDLASVPLTEVSDLVYGSSLLEYGTATGLSIAQASVRGPAPWAPGHTYLAVATSALKATGGAPVMAPFVFGFAKVSQKLLTDDGVPLIPASKEQAEQLEGLRAPLSPLLGWLEALPEGKAIPRTDVAMAWTFTASAANEALFDPTAEMLPFPNDVLLKDVDDPLKRRVDLPIKGTDPASVQALKGGLNTLDGFSNNGPATTAFSLPLDPATMTLIPDLFGLKPPDGSDVPAFGIGVADITDVDPTDPTTLLSLVVYGPEQVTARFDQGQLIIQNISGAPLPPSRHFMVILFSTLKSAGEGALPIHVSPVFWLARNELPLVDANGKSQLPSSLSDDSAAQLEQLRLAYKPIFDALQGVGQEDPLVVIGRDKVLGFFTFWTASTTADLSALAAALPVPGKGGGSMTPIASAGAPFADLPANRKDALDSVCLDCTMNILTLLEPPNLTDPQNPKVGHFQVDAQGAPVLTPRVLPFVLTVPSGGDPHPVVVFQHGIHGSKEDVAQIANELAKAGLASLAIDLPFHGEYPGVRIPGAPSGTAFFTADVFAVRDNMRQGALDEVQAIRFIRDRENGLVKQIPALDAVLDTTKVYFLGVSLGGLVGTLTAGLVPDLRRVGLVAPGGHMSRIFTETANEGFRKPLMDALAALGITPGTPAFLQFLMLAQWALDRADPVNWALLVAQGSNPVNRFRIVEAIGDEFIPNGTTEALAMALGIPTTATSKAFKAYAAGDQPTDTICHEFFLWGCDPAVFPALDQGKVAAAQAAARTFVIDFLKD